MRIKTLAIFLAVGLGCFAFQAREGDVSGKILDLNDEPVAEVALVFTSKSNPDYKETAETKKNGSFLLRNAPVGEIVIEAAKAGHFPRTYSYEQEGGLVRVTFRMVAEGVTLESLGPQPMISGVVEDMDGNPIPDVDLRISSEDLPGFEKLVKTGPDGSFEAGSLTNAEIRVHAKKDGYRDQIYQFTQPKKDYRLKNYRMQTLEAYFAEQGKSMPGKKELTPEELAVTLYNQAVEPFKQKDYKQAEVLAQKAFELDPSQEAALKMLIYANHNLKDWDEVISYSEKYLAIKPDDANIIQYAREAARLGNKADKAKAFDSQLKKMGVEVETPELLYGEAISFLNANDDDQAKPILEKILKMNDKFADAYHELGKLYIREGEFEAAILNLKLFLKHAPKDHKSRGEVTDLIVMLAE